MPSIEDTLRSLDYAKTDDDARVRYVKTRFADPFKDINCALLNREDIARYVAATGMIFPFEWQKLKPASYEARLGNEVLFWDDARNKKHLTGLSPRQSVILRHNSITYVGLDVRFRLPIYIAVRFNLTITHVHRGLLLGTGPLVDPGYDGRLMVPIHNLTPNDYMIKPGDDLVAIEFTKISANSRWLPTTEGSGVESVEESLLANVKKPEKTFDDFLRDCLPSDVDSVRSSLGAVVSDAAKEIKEARTANVGISVAAVVAISAALIGVFTLIRDVHQYVTESRDGTQAEIRRLQRLIESQPNREPTVCANVT